MRAFTIVLGMLPLLCSAHLKSPHQPVGQLLRSAPVLALVTVESAGPSTAQVERIAPIAGTVPDRFTVQVARSAPHTLQAGTRVVLALEKRPGGWFYAARTRRALVVPPGEQRAALSFIADWRAGPEHPDDALDRWLGLLQHSAEMARRVGAEALIHHADRLSPQVTRAQFEQLAEVVRNPDIKARPILRVMEKLHPAYAAEVSADWMATLSSTRTKQMLVGLLDRQWSPASMAALKRCAGEERGALATRCGRVIRRRNK